MISSTESRFLVMSHITQRQLQRLWGFRTSTGIVMQPPAFPARRVVRPERLAGLGVQVGDIGIHQVASPRPSRWSGFWRRRPASQFQIVCKQLDPAFDHHHSRREIEQGFRGRLAVVGHSDEVTGSICQRRQASSRIDAAVEVTMRYKSSGAIAKRMRSLAVRPPDRRRRSVAGICARAQSGSPSCRTSCGLSVRPKVARLEPGHQTMEHFPRSRSSAISSGPAGQGVRPARCAGREHPVHPGRTISATASASTPSAA